MTIGVIKYESSQIMNKQSQCPHLVHLNILPIREQRSSAWLARSARGRGGEKGARTERLINEEEVRRRPEKTPGTSKSTEMR